MVNRTTVKRHALPALVLPVVCLAVFFNTFGNEILWDDFSLLAENKYISDYKNIPLFFTPHYWNELHPLPGCYRPIRTISFAVDFFFWGSNPTGYHLTNIILHSLNVLLVYFLVSSLVSGVAVREPGGEAAGRHVLMGIPFVTAMLFAVHPIHTETINFIKNRSDLLAALFFLVSFQLFITHLSGTRRTIRRRLLAGAWICFIPAVLSKEMALTLPAVLALYMVCFTQKTEWKTTFIRLIPYGTVILLYFWFMHVFIRSPEHVAAGIVQPENIVQHLLTPIKTLGLYIKMLVVPFPLKALHNFDIPHTFLSSSVLLSLALLVFIGIQLILSFNRSRIVFFAMAWSLLTLVPIANCIYLASRPIAEQRLYLPSFGFCLLLGYGVNRLACIKTKRLSSRQRFMISGLSAIGIACLYTGLTVHRNFDWRNSVTFYSRALTANPGSAKMHTNLGSVLCREGKYAAGLDHLLRALRLEPDLISAHLNIGDAYYETGQYEKAIHHYQYILKQKPDFLKVYHWLGKVYNKTKRYQEAVKAYQTVLDIKPDHVNVHFDLGFTLFHMGNVEAAIRHYQTYLRLKPGDIDVLNNLGVAFSDMGQSEKAAACFTAVLRIAPGNVMAKRNLDILLDNSGG